MEHYKNLTNLTSKLLSSQPMSKMITPLLVSVSIFSSLLLSLSSLYSSPFIMYSENLNYFSSKYSFQMILGRAMNKNCVFLICNGLLVVLAKTSGFVRSPSDTFDLNEMLQNEIGDGLETAAETETEPEVAVEINEIPETPLLEKDITVLEDNCECKEEDTDDEHIEVKEVISEITGKEVSIPVDISDEEEKQECCLFVDEQDLIGHGGEEEDQEVHGEEEKEGEEEEEKDQEVHGEEEGEEEEEEEEEQYVDEMEKMSTEELNQKFEDFIRRMKEEFRINNEAKRQQLVMVN